jgi:hypothetical protein
MRYDAHSPNASITANDDIWHGLSESTVASALSSVDSTLLQMHLSDLRIDPRQPRQYLSADLRVQAAQGSLSPVEVLTALKVRAENGDLEGVQYAGDIEALGESLRLDGLIYPLKVEPLTLSDGRMGGQIVDGERRYWASVWCSMQPDSPPFAQAVIDVLMLRAEREDASMERLQWVANTQRRDMPVMILAEAAACIQAELASALQVNRTDLLARYGLANLKKGRDRMLLVQLTSIELHRRTGKQISERMLYRLLMFVNRMTTEARRLAIAANLDYRALETVAAATPAEQISVIRRIVDGLPPETNKPYFVDISPAIAQAMHQFELLEKMIETESRFWQALCKADEERRQDYLCAARDALNVLSKHVIAVEQLIEGTR